MITWDTLSQSFEVSPQDEVFGSVGFTFTRGHVENTISWVTLSELRACPSTGDAKRASRKKLIISVKITGIDGAA